MPKKRGNHLAYKPNQSLSSVIENESKSVHECQWSYFHFFSSFIFRSLSHFSFLVSVALYHLPVANIAFRARYFAAQSAVYCYAHIHVCTVCRCRSRCNHRHWAPYVMRKIVWILLDDGVCKILFGDIEFEYFSSYIWYLTRVIRVYSPNMRVPFFLCHLLRHAESYVLLLLLGRFM